MTTTTHKPFELTGLRYRALRTVDWVERICKPFYYWWTLVRDLSRSKSFPKLWLVAAALLSSVSFVAALLSVSWETCCPSISEIPTSAYIMAWVSTGAASLAFVSIFIALGKLLFPVFTLPNTAAYERLRGEVPEFRNIAGDFEAKVGGMTADEIRSQRRQISEELHHFIHRYRTLKRMQFVIVVFSTMALGLVVFAGLFLVDYVVEMKMNGAAPRYDFYQMEAPGWGARLLNAFHASVAMFVTMGIGRVESTFSKVIAITEVFFSAVMVFFVINTALAFHEQAVSLDRSAIMSEINRIIRLCRIARSPEAAEAGVA